METKHLYTQTSLGVPPDTLNLSQLKPRGPHLWAGRAGTVHTKFSRIWANQDWQRQTAWNEIFFSLTCFTVEDILFLWLEAWRKEFILVGAYGSRLITHHGTGTLNKETASSYSPLFTDSNYMNNKDYSIITITNYIAWKCRKTRLVSQQVHAGISSHLVVKAIMNN